MGKDPKRHFLTMEEVSIANEHIKRYSPSLTIKEIQIKIIARDHFTLTRMAIIKQVTSVGRM